MARYNQPTEGMSDWHIPLNENFADLGTEVMNEVETFADLPGPTGATSSQGVSRKYLVRETQTIYRDTGATWEAVAGSGEDTGSGGSTGKFGIHLNGSGTLGSPRGGLAGEIRSALDNGRSYINITGAWSMDGRVSTDSTNFSEIGIHIDARGAYIEYGGTGFMFTNDCTGNIAGQIDGGTFSLYGGKWEATGSPAGFWKGIDQSFASLYPRSTRNFDGNDSAIYELEVGTRWNEANNFGGQHHNVDTGIRDVNAEGVSYQDNYIDSINFGGVKNYAFDFTGNWVDCKIENPTCIVSANNAAFLRHNGNLGRTTIDNLEIEGARSNLDNVYMVEVGLDAKRGPVFDGNNSDFQINNGALQRFNMSDASGKWTCHEWFTNDDGQFSAYYGADGNTRWPLDARGFTVQTALDPNGPWSTQESL